MLFTEEGRKDYVQSEVETTCKIYKLIDSIIYCQILLDKKLFNLNLLNQLSVDIIIIR